MGDSRDPMKFRRSAGDNILVPGTDIELPLGLDLSRRDVLKIAGYGSVAAFLAACGGPTTTTSGSVTAKGGNTSLGSYLSDAVPKKGMQDVIDAFTSANGGTKVKVNTVDHGTFQNQITSYLQGTPEDVFTWFSGHRMRFFADKGLASPIDDVWAAVKSNYTAGFSASVKGNDGHAYAVPTDYYPWAVFYRKDLWAAKGYQVPTNWDAFKALCEKMKKDGLTPIAFADKDGWPAQGTFDILNLRMNGYDFHVNLLTGQNGQKWTDPKVTAVFKKWSEITKYYSPAFAGLTWEQGADQLLRKQAGMYLLGLFVSDEFKASGSSADVDQLDFFPFPNLGTQYDAEKALDAPIDVYMLTKKSPTLNADRGQAKAFMEFVSKGSTQVLYWKSAPGSIPTASDADTSQYPALTKKAVQIVSGAQRITQYFDRDSRPDFSGPNGMQGFLLKFLSNPSGDTTGLQGQMQAFWDSLPPE